MGEPQPLREIIAELMKLFEQRRNLEKQFASMGFAQRDGLSPSLAGIKEAGIGGLESGKSRN